MNEMEIFSTIIWFKNAKWGGGVGGNVWKNSTYLFFHPKICSIRSFKKEGERFIFGGIFFASRDEWCEVMLRLLLL